MFKHLTREEFTELSKQGKRIAVFQEMPSDLITPISAFQALTTPGDGAVLLESAVHDHDLGRYSFIGLSPIAEADSLETLQTQLEKYRCAHHPALPPLAGGAVGFVTYDAVRLFENIPDRHPDLSGLPDLFFQFHEMLLIFNHQSHTLTIVAISEGTYDEASQKIEAVKERLRQAKTTRERPVFHAEPVLCDIEDAEFCKMVEQARDHIIQGDAFQIVLSRRFQRRVHASPLDIYRALRLVSPAPFMFYIPYKDAVIVGASPERLVKVKEGMVETMPIAGTRPRGDDERLAKELQEDEKENAEHMMLVDLGRNDIGRVAEVGSVRVKELKTVRKFSHVMHLVSVVEGRLKKDYPVLDVLKAIFPAGTLSGAPKVRAMQIIDSLETSRRGLYGGAICTIDNLGNLDSCIAIRFALIQDGVATVRTGAGIVFDSDPQKEADETRHKATSVLEAIRIAEEGVL
jgi:anthranilate synthase component 1